MNFIRLEFTTSGTLFSNGCQGLGPEHKIYSYTKDFKGSITRFTPGALLPDGQLSYLKESTLLVEAYPDRLVQPSTWNFSIAPVEKVNTSPHYPTANEPDLLIDGFRMIGKGLRFCQYQFGEIAVKTYI